MCKGLVLRLISLTPGYLKINNKLFSREDCADDVQLKIEQTLTDFPTTLSKWEKDSLGLSNTKWNSWVGMEAGVSKGR